MLAVQNMMNTPVQEDTPAFMPKVDYSAPFVARTFGEGGDTEDPAFTPIAHPVIPKV